jgi:AcrR family transcriptional regulator
VNNVPEVPPRRRPKGDKRARTRALLLKATAELIRERGYDHTTLSAVAERAGMTSGAIYGNFKNKEELFLAVAAGAGSLIIPAVKAGMTLAQVMHAMAQAVIAAIPRRRALIVGTLGFHAYALTHEALRARVLAATTKAYRAMAAGLRAATPESALPMPPEHFVAVTHAMTDGLLLHRFLTPELVTDEMIFAAFAALAGVTRH